MEKLTLLPDQASYAYGNDDSVITTTLDGGYSRSRVDQLKSSAIINCTWRLYSHHYQYFKAFWTVVTEKGVYPFLIDLILDQPYLEEYEAKFVPGTVNMSEPEGLTYSISADLEVIPVRDDLFSQSIVDAYDSTGTYEYLNLLEKLVNIDLEPL